MVTKTQDAHALHECIRHVQQYIHERLADPDEPLNREVLAAVAGFSIPHFHRIFTATMGESSVSYVRRMRLERAGRKLRMGAVDITEVALAAGYDTHAAFSKAFKQRYGFSPSKFRELDCFTATQILKKEKPK
jgi:AraC family transcriptional regulator